MAIFGGQGAQNIPVFGEYSLKDPLSPANTFIGTAPGLGKELWALVGKSISGHARAPGSVYHLAGQPLTKGLRRVQQLQQVPPTLSLVGGKPSIRISHVQQLKPERGHPESSPMRLSRQESSEVVADLSRNIQG